MGGMNPATALARVLVDELVRCGVEHAVLAPGSRSAPLALELAAAEERGDLTLHVRLDERSAGYLALGLAKGAGGPVAVVTTSGTAAINLHPAVVEASYAGIPLLLLTADRPPELRGVGANQAIDQIKCFGDDVRWFIEVGVPRAEVGQVRYWRSLASRAVAVACDVTDPGPVHLNCAFAEPLVPSEGDWVEPLEGRSSGAPWTIDARMSGFVGQPIDDLMMDYFDRGIVPGRGVVLVGDGVDPEAVSMIDELSDALGWPVIVEPSANAAGVETSLQHGSLLLADPAFVDAHTPELVLTVGHLGLSRSVLALIRRARYHLAVDPRPGQRAADPTRTADVVVGTVPLPPQDEDSFDIDEEWLPTWLAADMIAAGEVGSLLDDLEAAGRITGLHVARSVLRRAGENDVIVVGPSWSARHVESLGAATAAQIVANRGTSGIDGVVSTAWGVAVAQWEDESGTTYALIGDLTALYDRNGLLAPEVERRPDLVLVIVDNDGGGIFSQLEQAGLPGFERVFGTPHGRDLAAALTGVECVTVGGAAGGGDLAVGGGDPASGGVDRALDHLVADRAGPRALIVRTIPRDEEAAVLVDLRGRIAAALAGLGSR